MSRVDWPFVVPRGTGLDVLGLGQNTMDHVCVVDAFPTPDTQQRLRAYELEPGGSVATAVAALARWGAHSAYVGTFGDDAAGRGARAALERDGVDCTAAVDRPGEPNATAVVLVDARTGARSVLSHRGPALRLDVPEVPVDRVAGARAVLLDGVDGPAACEAAAAARAAGVPTVLDVTAPCAGLDRLLALADVLLVSWEFARAHTRGETPEVALATLARRGHAAVGITLGRDGAIACVGEQCVRVPGRDVHVVDTNGAGAVFRAGFVWGLLDGLDLDASMRLANAAAALQCTRLGARRAIPALAQVQALAAS